MPHSLKARTPGAPCGAPWTNVFTYDMLDRVSCAAHSSAPLAVASCWPYLRVGRQGPHPHTPPNTHTRPSCDVSSGGRTLQCTRSCSRWRRWSMRSLETCLNNRCQWARSTLARTARRPCQRRWRARPIRLPARFACAARCVAARQLGPLTPRCILTTPCPSLAGSCATGDAALHAA